jgi:hypothetical protein
MHHGVRSIRDMRSLDDEQLGNIAFVTANIRESYAENGRRLRDAHKSVRERIAEALHQRRLERERVIYRHHSTYDGR